ncbi:MAG: NUDIX hydrolase [Bacillota bacterium]
MSYTTYVDWNGGRIRITWLPGAPLPPLELVTSAHGFCFFEGKVMLVDLDQRGGDIPGGHREPGETPEQTFRRECREEGSVEGRCTYIGCAEIDHSENIHWQPGGRYPRIGYQVFYRMDIERLLPFDAAFESRRRFFVEPAEAPRYHHQWHPLLDQILQAALEAGPE